MLAAAVDPNVLFVRFNLNEVVTFDKLIVDKPEVTANVLPLKVY